MNLKGTALCSYYLSKIMPMGSSIINISSICGMNLPSIDANAYNASKAGIINLTKSLAIELAPNIRVNAIAPAFVKTAMIQINKKLEKWTKNNIPLGRIAVPEDIVGTVVFLASDYSNYITGETIKIDGGMSVL